MRRHLTILFDRLELQSIEDVRKAWDPDMAAVVPAHLTLAYPEEFRSDSARLLQRAPDAVKKRSRFWVSMASVACEDEGAGGVFLNVVDPTNSWNTLRDTLLADPFTKLKVSPHVTLVHPRTSDRGPEAWGALRNWRPVTKLQVREICFTETSNQSFEVIENFSLQ